MERFLCDEQDGDDEMFSSDLTTEERRSRMGHMASVPTAAFLSGADEYVPPGNERSPGALAEAFRAVLMPSAGHVSAGESGKGCMLHATALSKVHIIDGANHSLDDENHAQEFVREVVVFVAALDKAKRYKSISLCDNGLGVMCEENAGGS